MGLYSFWKDPCLVKWILHVYCLGSKCKYMFHFNILITLTLSFQTYTYKNTHITVGQTLFQVVDFIFETSALAGKKKADGRHRRAWTESLKGSHTDLGHVWERNMFSNFQQTALLTREKHVSRIRVWLPILVCLKVPLWLCSLFGRFLKCFVCTPMLYSLTTNASRRNHRLFPWHPELLARECTFEIFATYLSF